MAGMDLRLENELPTVQVMHMFIKSLRAKDHRGVDLISDALPFGRLWYAKAPDAVDYAKFYSRSDDALIRSCDEKLQSMRSGPTAEYTNP
jgi:hypothetical protein